ncbi:hypothetical protein D3C84_901200 [compost metagenome]
MRRTRTCALCESTTICAALYSSRMWATCIACFGSISMTMHTIGLAAIASPFTQMSEAFRFTRCKKKLLPLTLFSLRRAIRRACSMPLKIGRSVAWECRTSAWLLCELLRAKRTWSRLSHFCQTRHMRRSIYLPPVNPSTRSSMSSLLPQRSISQISVPLWSVIALAATSWS